MRAREKAKKKVFDRWGKMLYYTADLPFPVTHTPDNFTQFRKEVEKYIPVRTPIETPTSIEPYKKVEIEFGDVPEMDDLGHEDFGLNSKGGFTWIGGESEALKQLQYYIWDTDLIANYRDTRNTKQFCHLFFGLTLSKG